MGLVYRLLCCQLLLLCAYVVAIAIWMFADETVEPHQYRLVFIKTFKGASETMCSIFARYGLERNLSFAVPLHKKIYLGWPYALRQDMIRVYSRQKVWNTSHHAARHVDMFLHHSVYSRETTRRLFPGSSFRYITILREPWRHLQSTFDYFNIQGVIEHAGEYISPSDPLGDFLKRLDVLEPLYTSTRAANHRWCIPDDFSVIRNLQSFSLGVTTTCYPGAETAKTFDEEIRCLDDDFDLVMIVEYIYESLVLLKRLMSWDLRDILFLGAKNRVLRTPSGDPALQALHQRINSADYALYAHFNRSLWKRISEQSQFAEEVVVFRDLQQRASAHCHELASTRNPHMDNSTLWLPSSPWSDALSVGPALCEAMSVAASDLETKADESDPSSRWVGPPSDVPFYC